MIQRFGHSRSWRSALIFAVVAVLLAMSLGGAFMVPERSAAGMMAQRESDGSANATPVAPIAEPHDPLDSDPFEGDPLDGDPLDGKPAEKDRGAPTDQTQLEIVRSGRPNDAPTTVPAYDDDPATIWIPDVDTEETWLWLDLGAERRLREVRWLARGSGAVEVSLSSDRQRWREVDRVDVDGGWQGIELRDDARYVRLTLLADEDGELPAIAESAVYGSDRGGSVSSEQKAEGDRERKRDRRARGDRRSASEQEAGDDAASGGGGGREERRSSGRVRISAEEGETRCRGNRERCEARQGEVSVEEDCAREGSCTIDVRADGGTAICDASGGDESRAGDGEGKRGGRGGRCEAVADGGAVTIGDVNP